jgi:hypothetical protein
VPVHHRVGVRHVPEWSILGCQSLACLVLKMLVELAEKLADWQVKPQALAAVQLVETMAKQAEEPVKPKVEQAYQLVEPVVKKAGQLTMPMVSLTG